MAIIVILASIVFTVLFICGVAAFLHHRSQINNRVLVPSWKPPAELNNDDRAWLNSQLELAGAEHLQISVAVPKRGHKVLPPPRQSTNMWTNVTGKRTHQGNNRGPYKNGYKPHSQKDIDRAAGYLRNLEARQTPDLITIPTRPRYDPVTDMYHFGSRTVSRQMYEDIEAHGEAANFLGLLEEPTYETVWK